jgi:ADP-ribose pyrophosphatase YjhB (NUDIX family)
LQKETVVTINKLPSARKQMWKSKAAKLVKLPLARWGIRLATKLIVPRQRVGVALVALNEAEEVFMLRHVYHPYYEWGLPGGWLKRNEAPAAAALRELREETGLTAVLGPAVTVLHDKETAHIGIAYLGKLHAGNLQLSHEIIEARCYPLTALPRPMTKHTQLAINAAALAYRKAKADDKVKLDRRDNMHEEDSNK